MEKEGNKETAATTTDLEWQFEEAVLSVKDSFSSASNVS